MIKNENYITIQGWMINELKLKGNDLIIYAIIYGFSQTEGTKFTGSLNYLVSATNSSRNTVIRSLKMLIEKELIIKQTFDKNGVKFNEFSVPSAKMIPGWCQNGTTPSAKMAPNNIDNNTSNNIDIETVKNTTPSEQHNSNSSAVVSSSSGSCTDVVGSKGGSRGGGRRRRTFVKPTIDEVRKFCEVEGLNLVDAYKFWKYYEDWEWTWYDSKSGGRKPLENWKRAVRGWQDREEKRIKEQAEKNKPVQIKPGCSWEDANL